MLCNIVKFIGHPVYLQLEEKNSVNQTNGLTLKSSTSFELMPPDSRLHLALGRAILSQDLPHSWGAHKREGNKIKINKNIDLLNERPKQTKKKLT